MQSYISHRRGRVFNPLIFFSFLSLSCFIDLLRKISEIIENMIFSLIFVLRKMWYFRQLRKITKIWYLHWAFLRKYCFSCSFSNSGYITSYKLFFSNLPFIINIINIIMNFHIFNVASEKNSFSCFSGKKVDKIQ